MNRPQSGDPTLARSTGMTPSEKAILAVIVVVAIGVWIANRRLR